MSEAKNRVKKSVSKVEMSSSSSSTSSFSSGEDSDNDSDLKPIKDYLLDRREVAKQLFKSVKTDKIRMMLPQVLKKVEFHELEDWCANELCGMSKKRILAILNGTPMSDSSDTSDSDDSGPSLEIISDTEEWLTDDGPSVKQEPQSPSSRTKIKINKNKSKNTKNKNETNKGNKNSKRKKGRIQQNNDTVKIKKEGEKSEPKNQEGESLLDLLELEMRARAIRALIRKEEDIIPNIDADQNKTNGGLKLNTNSSTSNATKSDKLNETSATLVEKIGEDEDVVLLIKPTPTIELISSDSENENSTERVNKKLESERVSEKEDVTVDKSISDNETIEKNVASPAATNQTGSDEIRTETKSNSNNDSRPVNDDTNKCNLIEKQDSPIADEKCITESKEEKKVLLSHDDKLGEYEEIIDLDDYPDDMDDIDTDEGSKIVVLDASKASLVKSIKDSEESIETWATRYYQTDSVQNVIKESKIQSEIRKRLRERQRLSKLNNSPKETAAIVNDENELKPLGSVDEYLALKNSNVTNPSSPKKDQDDKEDENQLSIEQQLPSVSSTSISPQSNLQASDKIDTIPS